MIRQKSKNLLKKIIVFLLENLHFKRYAFKAKLMVFFVHLATSEGVICQAQWSAKPSNN